MNEDLSLNPDQSNNPPNYRDPQEQRDRIILAYKLKQHGYRVDDIAKHLNCCQKTVYNYLHKYREEYLNELETKKALDIVVENLSDVEDLASLCLKLANQISQEETLDPMTGDIVPKKGSFRDKAEMLRLVRDFLKMKFEIQTQTGIMPRAPELIYEKLEDRRGKVASKEEEIFESRESLERKAIEEFEKQGWL